MYLLCVHTCLYVGKMINNDTTDRREELELFYYYNIHYSWSCVVLFESGLGLGINILQTLRQLLIFF